MRSRGFTLLEVLVSVAILGLGLTAILSAQAGAFASAAHARNISVATGLLRCKMNEVEEHLYKEGFQETDEIGTGPCCEGDETPNMRCTWHADRPTFPEAKFGDLDLGSALNLGGSGSPGSPGGASGGGALGAIGLLAGAGGPSPIGTAGSIGDIAKTLADANSQMAAGAPPPASPSSSSSSSSGGADMDSAGGGMGGLASLAMSFVYPSLKTLFEASTRRITASLTFREGNKEYVIEVVEWFSVPQTGLAATDDSMDGGVSTTPSTAGTGSASKPGTTVPTPSPGHT